MVSNVILVAAAQMLCRMAEFRTADALDATTGRASMTKAAQESVRDRLLAERDKGNVVFMGIDHQLMCAPLDEFIRQPVDGILYDLNRSEEVTLTFIHEPKWVNDFAVAQVIRKLIAQRDAALTSAESARAQGLREAAAVCEAAKELSGAYWRLEKYGYVTTLNADDDEHEAEVEHWIRIANQASERIRAHFALLPAAETKEKT